MSNSWVLSNSRQMSKSAICCLYICCWNRLKLSRRPFSILMRLLQSPKAQQDKARMNIDTILYMRLCGKLRLRLYIYARQFLIYAGFSCNFIQIFLYIWLVFAFLYEFCQIACNSNREFI